MDLQKTGMQNEHNDQMYAMETKELRRSDYFEDLANYIIVEHNETPDQEPVAMKQPELQWVYHQEHAYKSPIICVNDNTEDDERYKWKPGFCLQLGSQGRRAMLQLLRNVYKGNKKHKQIFERMNPPTTISNLPFFKVSMLWELAHQLDVFQEALAIHRLYGKVKSKIYRNQQTSIKPYYPNYDATNNRMVRHTKPRIVRRNSFIPNYENPGTTEEEGRYAVLRNKNVEQLKRNMECLLAVKKVGPDQFMKFMNTFKNRDSNMAAMASNMKECEQNVQMQVNTMYEYIPGMNAQMYPCNVMDCAMVPQ